jgi:hypothetical protein
MTSELIAVLEEKLNTYGDRPVVIDAFVPSPIGASIHVSPVIGTEMATIVAMDGSGAKETCVALCNHRVPQGVYPWLIDKEFTNI